MKTVIRILSYTKPYYLYLITALFCSVISVALTLLSPILVGKAIDCIIGIHQVDFNRVFWLLVWLGSSLLLSSLFQWFMTYLTNIVTFKTIRDIRLEVFEKLNHVPLKYIDSNAHGDIINRVATDTELISDGLLHGFTQLFTGIITILGTILFMITIQLQITIAVVLITPLSLFVASCIAGRSHNMFTLQSNTRGELSGLIEEMLGNQKIIKTFGYEDSAQIKFEQINSRLYDCGVKSQFYSSLSNPATRFVNGIVYTVVGVIGAVSVIHGRLSIGQLSSFLSYANQYTKPFNEITTVVTELQTASASARRVFEILDEPVEEDDAQLPLLDECDGSVSLNNVSFSYTPETRLIENLNLDVSPGQRIALVGPTGCGKTTIINLLMRFYEVTEGTIKITDTNINQITRKSLRDKYGMVLQDTWLFSGTVNDNIAYGKPNASKEEIIEAAKSAHAHNFIKRMPQGYNTVISEDGGNISQGQKQLLCIARIMLTKPPMLILDEATSSIDTRTEIYVQKAFDKMMKGRTSFVVAHRLSTIKEADTILVMNHGKIIETGNHESLLAQKGFYYHLYQSQFIESEYTN